MRRRRFLKIEMTVKGELYKIIRLFVLRVNKMTKTL